MKGTGKAVEYNFDLVVAGCNTCCRHCYVSGGPMRPMPLAEVRQCLEKLAPVLAALGPAASLTLDNELPNHPQAAEIIQMTRAYLGAQFYHHGSTTGIALFQREDRETIAEAWLRADCRREPDPARR